MWSVVRSICVIEPFKRIGRGGVSVASRATDWKQALGCAGALLVSIISIIVVYQLPARHVVDIGGYDAAYVQAFADAEFAAEGQRAYLAGSDGSARWSGASSSLIFPQAGIPAEFSLRIRSWPPEAPAKRVTLWLNGSQQIAEWSVGPEWSEYQVAIGRDRFAQAGIFKRNDFFLELRSDLSQLSEDGRRVGVLLDRVSYRVPGLGVLPYPAQLVYGAVFGVLLWLLLGFWRPQQRRTLFAAIWAVVLLLWQFAYRNQPPLYPLPFSLLLPGLCLLAALVLLWRVSQIEAVQSWLKARIWLIDLAAAGWVALWAGLVWRAAQNHLTLARPGVENDFRVFATRDTLERVFQADGFYNFGYPLLLWLVRPLFADNAFLAGRLIAWLCGVAMSAAVYWLACLLMYRTPPFTGRLVALLALVGLSTSPLFVEYALYVGSDAPFALCFLLTITCLLSANTSQRPFFFCAAGFFAGATFLMRHLGLVLLPWGLLFIFCWERWGGDKSKPLVKSALWQRPWLLFLVTAFVAIAPQIAVNTLQTSQPLYNQQAKNVWLCVYADCDWQRWDEVSNDIGLSEIVLRDPQRFFNNWSANIRAFVGTGGEDTSEFGRAIQLRLLIWPLNWLAIAALLLWLSKALRSLVPPRNKGALDLGYLVLLLLILLYLLAVSTAFVLPRFFLPLVPLYAFGAAWLLWRIWIALRGLPYAGLIALVCVLLLVGQAWSGIGIGTSYVLDGQLPDEVAAIRLVEQHVPQQAALSICVPAEIPIGKYSVIAHRGTLCSADADSTTVLNELETQSYLLWSDARGGAPLPESALLGRVAHYRLYRVP